ncbi:MAG: ABC transporter ATP-binding protein [Dysosmobacter sp.]
MAETEKSMPPRRPRRTGHGPATTAISGPRTCRARVKKLAALRGPAIRGRWCWWPSACCISSVASVASDYLLKPLPSTTTSSPAIFAGLLKKLLVLMRTGVRAARPLCSYAILRIMVRVSQRTVAALRQDLFDKLQELPLRYFDTHQSGDLMSRFTNDIDTVSEMINNSFANVLSNSLTFLCTIGMLLYLNWALTLITFAFLGLMLLVVKVIGGRSRVSFQRQQAALGDLNGYIEEMIEGQKVIKVFHHEQQAIDQFSARNDTYQTAATMAQTYAGSMMPATANLSRINYAVTCRVGGLLAMGGVFDIGSLGAYLLYVKQVSQPVSQISQQVNTILAAIAGAERIFAVMEAQPEEDEGQTDHRPGGEERQCLTEVPQRTGHWAWKKPGRHHLTELQGDVRFDHVDLRLRSG